MRYFVLGIMSSFNEPKRPESHQIGDIAKGQVIELFSSQGWVVDPTITDYGEDLIVQLTDKTSLIPVRFFVQLKGTKDIDKLKKKKFYSIPKLKQTSVAHWLNSETTTILLLWDIKKKTGAYAFTDELFRDKINTDKKFVTAHIPKEFIVNKKKINSFRVDAISNYCSKRYSILFGLESLIKNDSSYEELFNRKKDLVIQDIVHVVLFYLETLGILDNTGKEGYIISEEFRKYIGRELSPLLEKMNMGYKENFEEDLDMALGEALILAHMSWKQEKFQIFTPGPLLEGSFRILREMYEDTFQEIISATTWDD